MTSNEETLLNALRGLQHTLLAAANQINVILEIAERPSQQAPTSGPCSHPMQRRVPAPAMGHPTRFFCNDCLQEVEG